MASKLTAKRIPALYKKHGSLKAIARNTDHSWYSIVKAHREAVESGLMDPLPLGRKRKTEQLVPVTKQRVKALRPKRLVPKKGTVKRFIVTSAQNNTNLHEPAWENLNALADHYDATILVSPFLYHKRGLGARNDKSQLSGAVQDNDDVWYDSKIVPYLCKERVELAHGLVFCGELQILPTAVKPLSGLEVYTGRKSMIVPHTRQEMRSIATLEGDTKFNYSTGCVTLRNYIQAKAGLKAEFHHMYGGLIVEVGEEGYWHVRQLNADSDGTIYDWDLCAKDGVVTGGHYVEAIEPGDIHERRLKEEVLNVLWKKGGVVDQLRPKFQFINDLLDFHTRSHHDRKDPFKMFSRHVEQQESVEEEVDDAARFLNYIYRPWCQTIVKDSNHDRHLYRWLSEADGRRDPVNAEYWVKLNHLVYSKLRAEKKFILLEEAMKLKNWLLPKAKFIDCNTSFVICRKYGGGIECSMHGDLPFRAGLATFEKMGRRNNTGHGHAAGIFGGAFRAGKSCEDNMGYNDGASAWSDTFIVTYPNSKRTLVTIYRGKVRA